MYSLALETECPLFAAVHPPPSLLTRVRTQTAERILQQEIHTGRFILRESKTCAGSYTLSVLVDGEVRHIRVRDNPRGGICLREHAADREIFSDVLQMVRCYCNTKLQLRGSIPFYLLPAKIENMSEA